GLSDRQDQGHPRPREPPARPVDRDGVLAQRQEGVLTPGLVKRYLERLCNHLAAKSSTCGGNVLKLFLDAPVDGGPSLATDAPLEVERRTGPAARREGFGFAADRRVAVQGRVRGQIPEREP